MQVPAEPAVPERSGVPLDFLIAVGEIGAGAGGWVPTSILAYLPLVASLLMQPTPRMGLYRFPLPRRGDSLLYAQCLPLVQLRLCK